MSIFILTSDQAVITPDMFDVSAIPGAENAQVVASCNAAVADPKLAGQDGHLTLLVRIILKPKKGGDYDPFFHPFYYWQDGILKTGQGIFKNADSPHSLIKDAEEQVHQQTVSFLATVLCSRDFNNPEILHGQGLWPKTPHELGGVEDPRVVWIEEERKWLVIYTAVGIDGICVNTANTVDFKHFNGGDTVFGPPDKNAHPLPERVGEEWVWLRRPDATPWSKPAICISSGHDLLRPSGFWVLARPRKGISWEAERIGASGPAIRITPELAKRFFPKYERAISHGGSWWLILYHGKEQRGDRYCQGFLLVRFEVEKAEGKVVAQSHEPAMTPEIFSRFSNHGFVNDAIFCCGHVFEPETGVLTIAVSRADTDLWFAQTNLEQVNKNLVPVSN